MDPNKLWRSNSIVNLWKELRVKKAICAAGEIRDSIAQRRFYIKSSPVLYTCLPIQRWTFKKFNFIQWLVLKNARK
jgi:hypothetical protein